MIQATCIKKFRDKQGKIYGYRLKDCNGNVKDMESYDLKTAIERHEILVTNLTMTSDYRLIDSSVPLHNKLFKKEKQLSQSQLLDMMNAIGHEICVDFSNYGFINNGIKAVGMSKFKIQYNIDQTLIVITGSGIRLFVKEADFHNDREIECNLIETSDISCNSINCLIETYKKLCKDNLASTVGCIKITNGNVVSNTLDFSSYKRPTRKPVGSCIIY